MNKISYTYQPIFIIGAGRSGTTLMLKVIGSHPQIGELPSDINFVWTYNNLDHDTDDIPPENARPEVIRFIRQYFQKYIGTKPYSLEKSVCNTVRIPFLLKIFPNAKIIYILRDGRDVIESVGRNWIEIHDKKYLWMKIKAFPLWSAFPYAWNYAKNLVAIRLGLRPAADYIWGVKYPGYRQDLKFFNTLSVIARQWVYCVEKSMKDLENIPKEQKLIVRYEKLVSEPNQQIELIAQFLGFPNALEFNIKAIKKDNISKYKQGLTNEQLAEIHPIISDAMIKFGYTSNI